MSLVFQNIDPHTPLNARRLWGTPRLWCGGRTHSLGGEGGWGVNILEDARHSSVLYICKYFVGSNHCNATRILSRRQRCGSGMLYYGSQFSGDNLRKRIHFRIRPLILCRVKKRVNSYGRRNVFFKDFLRKYVYNQ